MMSKRTQIIVNDQHRIGCPASHQSLKGQPNKLVSLLLQKQCFKDNLGFMVMSTSFRNSVVLTEIRNELGKCI